ncbi:DUF1365 domain-containing protein [Pseudomonas sp. MM211]|uniref:DUF1365 domain-containing protein n=1 Tax=Pseudomonas sp. MM211 TaxID=2866808 RepID=UPI001CECA1BB|nr:DUF1365 domain-containing protein [Pseudomonas sp. MM211]UCJ18621.1 DUF1365 domain-containing protein [Pseudomonas sp. MM211]
MNSALYSGWVQHRRFSPRAHQFRYRMGLLYLDLDELDQVLSLSPLSGHSRWAPFSLRERDFLPGHIDQGVRLIEAVRHLVEKALGKRPNGAIYLLAQPRGWGLAFNPASFFYCHDEAGRLAAILVEVRNTPWHERYHYVLPVSGEGHQRVRVDKAFHVSPFLPRNLEYRMAFSPVGERLGIHMADWQSEEKLFDATLNLHRQPLHRAAVHRYLVSFPWMTGKTLAAIYWQALRLLLKRIPLFNHQAANGDFQIAQPVEDVHHEKP